MKRFITVLLIGMASLSLVACENQALTDAARSTGEQVAGQAGGIDMGDAALGAVGGMMLGNMLSGGGGSHHTTIIKEKKVYVQQPSTSYKPSTSTYRPSSSFSSGRSFSGGRR